MYNEQSRQGSEVAQRPTEGNRKGSTAAADKANAVIAEKKRIGRPLGSKNKAKGLIPNELADQFLGVVKELLPPEYYEEMKDAIKRGKHISTLTEAKITLKLLGPPVWRALLEEGKGPQPKPADLDPEILDEVGETNEVKATASAFTRSLNERLKVYLQLLTFIDSVEKRLDERADPKKSKLLVEFANRGYDGDRLRQVAALQPGGVGGSTDRVGGEQDQSGAIPDPVLERHEPVQDNSEEPPVWVVDMHSDRVRT